MPERTAAQPLARRATGRKPVAIPACQPTAEARHDQTTEYGEMAERFKAPVLKTGVAAMPPWVRIPLSPPFIGICC